MRQRQVGLTILRVFTHTLPKQHWFNEFYARDSSRKIQAIFKARMQDGKRVSPSVPYGYRRDPQDKQHLVVDEEAAPLSGASSRW